MTIEEIEWEWAKSFAKMAQNGHDGTIIDHLYARNHFASVYIPRLLAVAKAAKKHIEWCDDAGIDDGELEQALKKLEKHE